MWKWSRKVVSTNRRSPFRNSPLSTKTQVSWSPIALCRSTAVTDESTPPESPQITRLSPTLARMSSRACSAKSLIFHDPLAPHTS
jgi:hypothetical protein